MNQTIEAATSQATHLQVRDAINAVSTERSLPEAFAACDHG